MIKINKVNNSLTVEGVDNVFYPNNGDNSYPLNSLIVVTDNSDMATFRSVATNDVLFSGLIEDITINGEAVTKDNIITKFDAVSNSSTGGGGGGGTVDAYTKEEADNKFASKDELTNVQTVANDADTKVDALTPRVEGVETTLGNKQDTLVSGANIKTINNQSILGEGNIEISDYYTKTEADEIFATTTEVRHQAADISALQTDMRGKQATLVSGENIKTINSESILGSGDIQINGVSEEQVQEIAKIPTIEAELAQKANASDVATQQEVNVIAANVSALESDMANKQPTLVSGTNIKTINGESVLGEGNIEVAKKSDIPNTDNFATKDELTAVETIANNAATKADTATSRVEGVETALNNKQDTLVSGTNIKTINNESLLGTGDIQISGGVKLHNINDNNSPLSGLWFKLKDAIPHLNDGTDYHGSWLTMNESLCKQIVDLMGTIKDGDLLGQYDTISGDIFKVIINPFAYAESGNSSFDLKLKYLCNSSKNVPNYSSDIILNFVFYESSSRPGNYIEVTFDIYTNAAGPTAKITDIPNTDNFATKDELTAVETSLGNKQDTLVSGTNIKTINSQSILGEGNIEVTIPDATTATSGAMSAADKTKLNSLSNEWTGTQSEFDALTTKEDNKIYYVTE